MKYSFLLITISISINSIGQVFSTESKDTSNIYHFSLIKYCEYLDQSDFDDARVFVEYNSLISDDLPDLIDRYKIQFLNSSDIKKKTRGKNSITLVRIIPLRVQEDKFFVNVIPFSVSYNKRKNEFFYVNGGGMSVIFSFDPEQNGLVFKSADFKGI